MNNIFSEISYTGAEKVSTFLRSVPTAYVFFLMFTFLFFIIARLKGQKVLKYDRFQSSFYYHFQTGIHGDTNIFFSNLLPSLTLFLPFCINSQSLSNLFPKCACQVDDRLSLLTFSISCILGILTLIILFARWNSRASQNIISIERLAAKLKIREFILYLFCLILLMYIFHFCDPVRFYFSFTIYLIVFLFFLWRLITALLNTSDEKAILFSLDDELWYKKYDSNIISWSKENVQLITQLYIEKYLFLYRKIKFHKIKNFIYDSNFCKNLQHQKTLSVKSAFFFSIMSVLASLSASKSFEGLLNLLCPQKITMFNSIPYYVNYIIITASIFILFLAFKVIPFANAGCIAYLYSSSSYSISTKHFTKHIGKLTSPQNKYLQYIGLCKSIYIFYQMASDLDKASSKNSDSYTQNIINCLLTIHSDNPELKILLYMFKDISKTNTNLNSLRIETNYQKCADAILCDIHCYRTDTSII